MILELRELRAELTPLKSLRATVPIVLQMSMEKNSFWNTSQKSKSSIRGDDYRTKLLDAVECPSGTMPPCMISGVRGSAAEIICGHIVGVSNTDEKKLAYLQMKSTDLNEPNNLVFWARGFEEAYERMQLPFTKSNPLRDALFLHIWDDSIREKPIYPDAVEKMGYYEGMELKSNGHVIIRRGLSYHAYLACLKHQNLDGELMRPSLYGSPGPYPFKTEADILWEQFSTAVQFETLICYIHGDSIYCPVAK